MYHGHHHNVISYEVSSGESVKHYNRKFLRDFYALGMGNNLKDIAERQRRAIQAAINKYDLEIAPIARKAGFAEGTLRFFLNLKGRKQTKAMGSDKVESLANAIGIPITELLGISPPAETSNIDADLMMQCIREVKTESKALKEKYTLEQTVLVAIESYNYVMAQRQKGKPITEAGAAVSAILKKI